MLDDHSYRRAQALDYLTIREGYWLTEFYTGRQIALSRLNSIRKARNSVLMKNKLTQIELNLVLQLGLDGTK